MTLLDIKKKTLALIEELNPDSKHLTDDPDISAKFNFVTNQIMHELCRIKKIAKYAEMTVKEGDMLTLDDFGAAVGYDIYQLGTLGGVGVMRKANNTVFKVLESGVLEVDCFVYPEAITDKTPDSYEFELSADVLEIMPYGIAADLLKSDISAGYGGVYSQRYETMLQRLDVRNAMPSISVIGGFDI